MQGYGAKRPYKCGSGMGAIHTGSQAFSEPELLGELQKIFDQAWRDIAASGLPSSQAEKTRVDLAQMIMLAHRSGLSLDAIRQAVARRIYPE